MGMGMELVTGFVTAPSTTLTGWTMAAGNTLTVRNARLDSRIWLLQMWADNQGAGILQVRSPKLHDNVRGIRAGVVVSEVQPLLPQHFAQRLVPQDLLIAEQSGSATAGDIETGSLLLFYEDLPGSEGRFISEAELIDRMVNLVTVENTLATGTAGGYSGEEAINAESDLLKANTDYALVGYLCSAECASVRWRGPDTGNLGLGGPGSETDRWLTASWFLWLCRWYNMPLIPVINSANKGGTLIDAAQDENGTDVLVSSIFAELAPRPGAR